MMNLTLMTLQWGTMSSGRHSGSPSCSSDQSCAAAQQGEWEPSKEPGGALGQSPRNHLMPFPGGVLPRASADPWVNPVEHGNPGKASMPGNPREPLLLECLCSVSIIPLVPSLWPRLVGKAGRSLENWDGARFGVLISSRSWSKMSRIARKPCSFVPPPQGAQTEEGGALVALMLTRGIWVQSGVLGRAGLTVTPRPLPVPVCFLSHQMEVSWLADWLT